MPTVGNLYKIDCVVGLCDNLGPNSLFQETRFIKTKIIDLIPPNRYFLLLNETGNRYKVLYKNKIGFVPKWYVLDE